MKKLVLLLAINVSQTLIAQNVGIGILTPNAKLSISVNGTELVGTASGNIFRTNAGILGSTAGSELNLANIGFLSSNNSSLGIRAYRNSAGTDWTTTALLLGYDVDNTVRAGGGLIAISANGNIGIGTTNPLQKLHVEGATYLNGNVVIGINTPSFPLSFAPALGDKISLWSNSTNSYGFGIQGSLLQIHTDISAADIAFGYGSSAAFTEVMRIKGNGNVGIGTSIPSATAALDVSSITKGFLPPRMTSAQRDAITPAEGLMIYNTTSKKPNFYDGSEWRNFDGAALRAIGDNYQGGIIAYILQPGDPGYIAGQTHGLIAAASDQSIAAEWGCYGTAIPGADGTALGTGNQNTIDIMAGCATAGIAARICGDLVLNGYSDWYLPSRDELNKLYINQVAIGGFANDFYWSSTEFDNNLAYSQKFFPPSQYANSKPFTFYVRAVRAF